MRDEFMYVIEEDNDTKRRRILVLKPDNRFKKNCSKTLFIYQNRLTIPLNSSLLNIEHGKGEIF